MDGNCQRSLSFSLFLHRTEHARIPHKRPSEIYIGSMTGLQHHQGWWERMHVSTSKLLWNKREVDGYRVALDTTSQKSLQ